MHYFSVRVILNILGRLLNSLYYAKDNKINCYHYWTNKECICNYLELSRKHRLV